MFNQFKLNLSIKREDLIIDKMKKEENLTLFAHKCKGGYVGELNISKSSINAKSGAAPIETIVILDISGSMGSEVNRILTKILPNMLTQLNYPDDRIVHLITFESNVEYHQMTKTLLEKSTIEDRGGTSMEKVFIELSKIILSKQACFRILTISDGDVWDQKETLKSASEFAAKIKGQYSINSQAIRFFTSSSQPDTTALSSVLQLNTIGEAKLIDIDSTQDNDLIVSTLSSLFSEDGLDIDIKLQAMTNNFRLDPWSDPVKEIRLIPGKNVLWFTEPDGLSLLIGKTDTQPVKIEILDDVSMDNYRDILGVKIDWYIQKLKVLKIVGTEQAMKEMSNMIQYFQDFENSINLEKDPEMSNYLVKPKIASRIVLMKTLHQKRIGLVSTKMKQIQNDDIVNSLNNQQKADYLRNINTNDKTGKGLAKRAVLEGLNFDEVARNEVIEMSKHIDELKDIDFTDHHISFYSTTSTLEGIRLLCGMVNDSIFKDLEVNDIVKLLNIVGIGCEGKIGNYPDPALYHLTNIYPGCFVSFSDILEVATINKNEELKVPGGEGYINNAIPIFDDERIHQFLLKYAPHLLEYTASIGMRRILAEVPNTYENMIVAGLWKMLTVLNTNKSEINIKMFISLLKSNEIAAGRKYMGVLKEIEHQKDEKELALYLNNYNLNNMITPLLKIIREKKYSHEMIAKITRAIYQVEVYQLVRSSIRQSEDQAAFVSNTLEELLGIDYEKHGTKLPALFEKNLSPKYYEEYELNEAKLNEIYNPRMKWTELISALPDYLSAAEAQNPIEAIKNIPTLDEDTFQKNLEVQYDVKLFKLFNIVQSLIKKEKVDRVNDEKKTMKIIDLVNFAPATKNVKTYVLRQYQANYQAANQKQIKLQIEIISKELVEALLAAPTMEDYKKILKEGITKGYLTYKLEDPSTKGFLELKQGLIDKTKNVPERLGKIIMFIMGTDEKDEVVWNKGNTVREKVGDFQAIVNELDKEAWKKMLEKMKGKKSHTYRELENRQGHSNKKPSYWALGFNTLEEMWEILSDEEKKKYQEKHYNCCGVPGNKGETHKAEQRRIRKEKKKAYRKNK